MNECRTVRRVLILATDGFEQCELLEPRKALEAAGIETVVASPKQGKIRGWHHHDWGQSVAVDAALGEVEAEDFDGLLLPGGQMNPDALRLEDEVLCLIEEFDAADKPIAAICHGPSLLAEADIVEGRGVTAWPSIRSDLENAGAQVFDEGVLVDGNLITSRDSTDIPALSRALIDALGG
ncbi:type 1 glutamine amidotransferase domain-containing protein [Novosphingobium bradum]|uniref:Type 1 glutamine amidotransferase domain-containing protein n=1 Tax=Novosphingobium bradum TaxID=1737444 RepID=A0ABV7ITH1_9SPHN